MKTLQVEFCPLYWVNSPDERSPQPKRECEIGVEVGKWSAQDRIRWMKKERKEAALKKQCICFLDTMYLYKFLYT